jgi:hypothetical protein
MSQRDVDRLNKATRTEAGLKFQQDTEVLLDRAEREKKKPEVRTAPLGVGEEDNAKYKLRDGTMTGCQVLADLDMPTEADLFRD